MSPRKGRKPAEKLQLNFEAGLVEWEISPRVNSQKNDDPSLWEPLHAQPTQTTTVRLNSCARSAEAHPVREPLTDKTTSTAPPA